MGPYNLCTVMVALACWGAVSAERSKGDPTRPDVPAIGPRDMRFLSRTARRACEQFIEDQTLYTALYVPPALAEVRCEVIVTLRRQGGVVGIGSSGPGPVTRSVIEAALAAVRGDGARSEDVRGEDAPGGASSLLIEIEAIGPERPVPFDEPWSNPEAINQLLEPGLDGVTVRSPQRIRRVTPAELAAKNLLPGDALKSLMEEVGGPRKAQQLSRFRSLHWYQSAADGDIVSLRRGLSLLDPRDVTPVAINGAIDAMTRYLIKRQRPSGAFLYEYEPAAYAFTHSDNPVHQAGAVWALAVCVRSTPTREVIAAADAALEAHMARLRPLPGVENAACITSADGRNKLGTTAQIILALTAREEPASRAADVDRLVQGVLWLQKESGEFITAFPPARRLSGYDVFPGVTLLALAERYDARPDPRLLNAFNRAFTYYRSAFAATPSIASAAWLARAFARMAVIANRRDFAAFAFDLTDFLVERQLTRNNSASPELSGGVRDDRAYAPGIRTAVCLSAFLDGRSAAGRFNDESRRARYERSARRAVRFVMQLQFRSEDTFHMPDAGWALGGVRNSATDNRVRLENVQYALQALIQYRDATRPGDY